MADTQEQDPSIEEILASIRQIISDDDDAPNDTNGEVKEAAPVQEQEPTPEPVAEEEPQPTPEPEPTPESVAEEEVEVEDDAFDLTPSMQVDQTLSEPEEDMQDDFDQAIEDIEDGFEDETIDDYKSEIVSKAVATSTVGAFSKLSENVALSKMHDNITLEEIVKDMLRPMLREWIDTNMPNIVEVLVEKELEKLARHAKDS